MFDFLRRKKGPARNRFRVRVEPFDSENVYYCILYSFNGGFTWKRYEHCDLYWDESLCSTTQPYLFGDFDRAVEAAKSLTEESVKKHEVEESEKYLQRIKEIREKRASRDRTFST